MKLLGIFVLAEAAQNRLSEDACLWTKNPPGWKSKFLLPSASPLVISFRGKSMRSSHSVPERVPYWNHPLIQLYSLEFVETSGRREVSCQASANFSCLQQSGGERDLHMGQPDVPALAGNKVEAPPQSPRAGPQAVNPTPFLWQLFFLTCCLQIQLPPWRPRSRGSTQAPGPRPRTFLY